MLTVGRARQEEQLRKSTSMLTDGKSSSRRIVE